MSEQPLNVPHIIADRYAIEREVGRGGMAVVYFAKDLRHFRDVAVKIFRRDGNEPDEGSERFLQEIKIAARLSHPNILPLHDSGDDHGLLYYVMPYVPGESLRQRLEREGALPLTDALTIATGIANALAYAHSHGVIHRDIKPENILFIAGNAVVADFGIARAISAGGWDEWKLAGPAGTPAYMSPEQGRGGSRVDGRSDLYSLGCVLYEMLTGEPPFRGSTPEELVVQHMEAEPLPVHTIRPTLPRDVQLAVGKALAKHPADRYQTALQMAEALARLQASTSGEHEPRTTPSDNVTPIRRPPVVAQWLRRWGGPSFIAAGLAAAIFWTTGAVRTSRLDPSLLFVGPLVHRDSVPADLDGEQCSRLLTTAISRWEDVRSADSRWAYDQLKQLGHAPKLDELVGLAQESGAGRLLSGEVWRSTGDSVKVRVVLYDVRRGHRVLKEHTVAIAPGLSDVNPKFMELVDSLLLPRPQSVASISGILGTSSIEAWATYDSGHAALGHWDLERARSYFTSAIALDPTYQLAYLWRAQTRSWQREKVGLWREDARRGLEHPLELTASDREWGKALLALADGRYPDACTQFNAMLERDTLDFRGWFGRGDCRARDPAVIRNDASPSKFAFRSSYAAAISDYDKALTLVPSSHLAFRGAAFDRLRGILMADLFSLRGGRGQDKDSTLFAAFPTLEGDTLAFIPWPSDMLAQQDIAGKRPHTAAVRRNLERLTRITGVWARDFPSSSSAQIAQARALELMGQIDAGQSSPSAITAIVAARKQVQDSIEAVELKAIHFRLLLKAQNFAAATALADSLFREVATDPTAGQDVAGIATLLGRPSLAGRLLREESNEFYSWFGAPVHTNNQLRQSALRLLAFSSVGGPRDSVEALYQQVQEQIRAYGLATERVQLRSALVDHATLLLPVGWGDRLYDPVTDTTLATWRTTFRREAKAGNLARVRQMIDSSTRDFADRPPWQWAPEFAVHLSEVRLPLGDTAQTVQVLDLMLNSMAGMNTYFLDEQSQAGAIVRLMFLRMDLAEELGDLPTARRWAKAVTTLWAEAEPGLQPMLANARRLAQ